MAQVSRGVRELALVAAVLAVSLVAVLWRPIAFYGTHTFAPVDLPTQATSLTRVDEPHRMANVLLPDPVLQMQPWALFNGDEFAAGRAPLWNPRNACGVPHLANYQSAPFSPFTWPFYVLPYKAALIVASFAKLFALALFTALFLRELGCSLLASLFGALAFATSGFSLLLHQYPHAGAMLAVPGGLYFAERSLRELEDGAPRLSLAPYVGLALVLAVAALAGHPEALGYGLLVLAAYCAWRVIGLWARRAVPRRRVARAAAALVGVGALGGGLAALQVVPFAEYLARSSSAISRVGAHLPLERANWPLLVYPNLAGTPLDSRLVSVDLPKPNYEEFTTFYVGGVVLALALLGVVVARRRPGVAFFAVLTGVWVFYAWNVFGVASWLARATPLGLVPIHRTQPLWTPAVCVLAAFALDSFEREAPRRRVASSLALLAVGAAALLGFRHGAHGYVEWITVEFALDDARSAAIEGHVRAMTAGVAIGVAGIALCWLAWNAWTRHAGRVLVIGAMLFEGAWVLGGYVPIVEDRFSFPRTQAIEDLRSKVGDERLVVLSRDSFRPDANLVYGVSLLTNYDALDVAEYQRLFKHFYGGPHTLRATKLGLELFGVKRVATRGEWVPVGTELAGVIVERHDASAYLLSELQVERAGRPLAEVTPERPWKFEFEATREGFDALCLHLLDEPKSREARCAVRVRDLTRGEIVFDSRLSGAAPRTLKSLHRLPDAHLELVVPIASEGPTANHAYEIELSTPDATSDAPIRVARGGKGKGYRSHGEPSERDSGPALDVAYGRADFEPLGRAGAHFLWNYAAGRGRGWIVGHALAASSADEAFELVTSSDFDPYASVVLEGRGGGTSGLATDSTAELVSETPRSQRWRTASSHPGWFVLAQTHFPGWTARVDGREVPVLRANHAFTALALDPGEHEIELDYAPASFRIGLVLSLASAVAGLAAFAVARRASRG